ncbi:MAG: hypothetical protein ACE5I7_12935 [Candidatus Binatia bacterium]
MARTIKMLSDMNTTMMEVERVDRVADRLMVTGIMMGNFPAEIYLTPDDLLAMIALHLRPSPLAFLLGLPYFWLRCHWQRPENRRLSARARVLVLSTILAFAGLCGAAALMLGLFQLSGWLVAVVVHAVRGG